MSSIIARSSRFGLGASPSNLLRHSYGISRRFYAGEAAQASKKAARPTQKVELHHLGIGNDIYIQPSKQHLPSWFTSPKLRFRGIYRRLLTLFQMTVMVAQFRLKSSIKPRFVEWKNLALETYVSTNKAFAANKLDTVKDQLSVWVYESLKTRLKSLPVGTQLDWKLVKFNSTPRVMFFQPLMLPGEPLSHCQIIYKIDSKQRLARVTRGSDKAHVAERDVTDYVAFTIDASKSPPQIIMAGSVFETPLDQPRPDPSKQPSGDNAIVASMKEKGDIFRNPPQLPSA